MIQLPRSLVRDCRAVFRRIAGRNPAVVTLEAGGDGLRVRLHGTPILAEYHQPGLHEPEVIGLPLAALADLEGRQDTLVTFQAVEKSIVARWQEGGIPREKGLPVIAVTDLADFPQLPVTMAACEPRLLPALADATDSAGREAARYALRKAHPNYS